MNDHLNQAQHNLLALNSFSSQFPDDFFDWKITLSFYVALYYVRARASQMGVTLRHNHKHVREVLKPKDGSPSPLGTTRTFATKYQNLYRYSRTARYDGFCSKRAFDSSCRANLGYAQSHLRFIENELIELGLPISASVAT